MPDSPLIQDPAWSCTITASSATVTVSGVVPSLFFVPGDKLIGAGGQALAIAAVSLTGITLVRPAPASEAGTVPLVVERTGWRFLPTSATVTSHDVYAQLQIAKAYQPSTPVLAVQNAPPTAPSHGDRYLIGTAPTGAWAGKPNTFAEWSEVPAAGWLFDTPAAGRLATVSGSATLGVFTGSAWIFAGPGDYVGKVGDQFMQGSLNVRDGAAGYISLVSGNSVQTGYLAFHNPAGDRQGYLGFASGGSIKAVAEAGNIWEYNASILSAGEMRQTFPNGFRIAVGSYGVFWRNDGATFYLMYTNPGDPFGGFGSKRPFALDLASGAVFMGEGLSVSKKLNTDGNVFLGSFSGSAGDVPLAAQAALPPNTVTARSEIARFGVNRNDQAADGLRVTQVRTTVSSDPNDWASMSTRLSRWVDVTEMSYVSFGANNLTLSADVTTGGQIAMRSPASLLAYTLGTLPAASACSGCIVRVTDGAAGKAVVISDGTVWRYMDGTQV